MMARSHRSPCNCNTCRPPHARLRNYLIPALIGAIGAVFVDQAGFTPALAALFGMMP